MSASLLLTLALLSPVPSGAPQGIPPGPPRGVTPESVPLGASVLPDVAIDQKLGAQVDLDLEFTNANGERVRLGDFFGERPVILALVYYECPMLCGEILSGMVSALRELERFEVGRDFDVLGISFDAGETPELASATRRGAYARYARGEESGWNFLVSEPEPVAQLAQEVGFRYVYDPESDEYAHSSAILILTPGGEVSRYFFGIEYAPRDLQLGLTEASEGTIGGLAEEVLLYCLRYDPTTGKYGLAIMNVIRALGIGTVAVLVGFILVHLRRDRRAAGQLAAAGAGGSR